MCYFHVKYKVRKHLNSLISADNFDKVMRDITELHVLKASADYEHKIQLVLNRWKYIAMIFLISLNISKRLR